MKNSLRISGGSLRGKKIPFEFKDTLRPTSSKLKEILFNWLQFEINQSICLDLFAGTGSLGIEAISRGSPKVLFVELNKKNYLSLSRKHRKYSKDNFSFDKMVELLGSLLDESKIKSKPKAVGLKLPTLKKVNKPSEDVGISLPKLKKVK